MNPKHTIPLRRCERSAPVAALLLAAALGWPLQAQAQAAYASAEQAADALLLATATHDADAMSRVLGKGWRKLLSLEDVTADDRYAFLEKAAQKRDIQAKDGHARLVVGTDPWSLPVPIVQGKDGQWRFDPVAAQDEMAVLALGANERAAMMASQAYVDAQLEYALVDRNGDGVYEYAQKLLSSPGKRDGLIWSESLGDRSPLGEAFLPAKPGEGYHGYRYRILKGQGDKAPGGARNYLIGPRMTAGFALVAWPVKYGVTGVMSFLVGSNGAVYEKDLGPQTARAVESIKLFNPGDGWKPTKP
jgi:hypothetical protein